MTNFLKTTKWWMYLPFAPLCGKPILNWIINSKTKNESHYKMLYVIFNVLISSIVVSILIVRYVLNIPF